MKIEFGIYSYDTEKLVLTTTRFASRYGNDDYYDIDKKCFHSEEDLTTHMINTIKKISEEETKQNIRRALGIKD